LNKFGANDVSNRYVYHLLLCNSSSIPQNYWPSQTSAPPQQKVRHINASASKILLLILMLAKVIRIVLLSKCNLFHSIFFLMSRPELRRSYLRIAAKIMLEPLSI